MIDTDAVMAWDFGPLSWKVEARDVMLYALSLGYGRDPMDEGDLRYVFEKDLLVVPSFGSIVCHPSGWLQDPRIGVTWSKVVHGEQNMTFHRPFPSTGTIDGHSRILGVDDKGLDKGATILMESQLRHRETGDLVATITRTSFCRADGGCGSAGQSLPPPVTMPDRAADRVVPVATWPGQALLYRLNGDYNPLHASPPVARQAGFERPILHGLCTYGLSCKALIASLCEGDPERLAYLGARFTAPVFPGDALALHLWEEGDECLFECHVPQRGKRVLGAGRARLN